MEKQGVRGSGEGYAFTDRTSGGCGVTGRKADPCVYVVRARS